MPIFQKLESIRLVRQAGREGRATRNGNNAAWLCCRCSEEPLLGTGLPNSREKPVKCGRCGARYHVEFGREEGKLKPVRVVELSPDQPVHMEGSHEQ